MKDWTIKFDPLEQMARVSIDGAIHDAMKRFKREISGDERIVHRIAEIAAMNAVERFKTICNNELRLIQLDYEQRADSLMHEETRLMVQAIQGGAFLKPGDLKQS